MNPPGTAVATVAVVDDDPLQRHLLDSVLQGEGHEVHAFGDGESFLAELPRLAADVVLLDVQLPGISGLEILQECTRLHPHVAAVMLTADEDVNTVVEAMRLGALEYLVKPVQPARVLTTVRNVVNYQRTRRRVAELEARVQGGEFPGLLGQSDVMRRLYALMHRVAATDVSVLIRGESGTGKELVARAIHQAGDRAAGPFVAINCASVPESLQESELFGHERGAFTGATSRRQGRFEQADGGTLFLDEGGELSPSTQAKLLRVLQERRFYRVGGSEEIRSDFRLVVATHRDLRAKVREGSFREDLYYRVAVFEVLVPPLRERGDDVLLLARTFAERLGRSIRGEPCTLAPDTADILQGHSWPGNVRELENAVQRALVASTGSVIEPGALPDEIRGRGAPLVPVPEARNDASGVPDWGRLLNGMRLEEIERVAIDAALERHDGNRSRVAEELGIARATLYRKLDRRGRGT